MWLGRVRQLTMHRGILTGLELKTCLRKGDGNQKLIWNSTVHEMVFIFLCNSSVIPFGKVWRSGNRIPKSILVCSEGETFNSPLYKSTAEYFLPRVKLLCENVFVYSISVTTYIGQGSVAEVYPGNTQYVNMHG